MTYERAVGIHGCEQQVPRRAGYVDERQEQRVRGRVQHAQPVQLRGRPHDQLDFGLLLLRVRRFCLDADGDGPVAQRVAPRLVDGLEAQWLALEEAVDGLLDASVLGREVDGVVDHFRRDEVAASERGDEVPGPDLGRGAAGGHQSRNAAPERRGTYTSL